MTRKRLISLVLLLALTALAASAHALFQADPLPTKMSGLLNDFSPTTTAPAGPYLVTGPWTLQWQPSGKAEFTASLTMVRPDATSQATRNFHTHHLRVSDGAVTIAGNSIVMTGDVVITSNGNQVLPGSSVQVEITGGSSLALSNMRLTFIGPAAAHFTSEPYEGVLLVE